MDLLISCDFSVDSNVKSGIPVSFLEFRVDPDDYEIQVEMVQ